MRFTNQKRNHPFKNIVISVIIFLSVAGLFNYGVQSMSKQSIDEQQTNLETAIERCVSQYYVLVGHYPESLNVLEKEYGLTYNKKIFFVDYQVLGENIAPDIVVIRKEGVHE